MAQWLRAHTVQRDLSQLPAPTRGDSGVLKTPAPGCLFVCLSVYVHGEGEGTCAHQCIQTEVKDNLGS